MKNLIFKSSFHEKLKMLLIAIGLMVTSLTTQVWASTTFADGDVLFYDFSDVTGGGGVNWQANGTTMVYDPSGAGTIKCVIFTSSTTWTTSWTIAKTAKGGWANIAFPSDRPSGKNCLKIDATGKTASWTTISLAEKVAKGDLIMVYGGELSSWNQSNYYFIGSNSNTTDNTKALANANKSITINNQAYKFGPVALPSGTYIQGHWASNMSCAIAAGSAYVVRGSGASATYFTQKANSGSDYLYQVIKQSSTSPTTTLSPTCPSSITAGSKLSFTPGSAGVSVLGRSNSIKYYLKNGSTYTEKTLSDGKLDVSDLGVGEYSIITLLDDGYILVKASTSNFSVTAAATATLTYHANYIAGSGSGTGDVPAAQTVTLNSSATVANKNTLAFVNYTFSGWNTEEHITGTSYEVGSSITMNENKDLYAVWTRAIPLDDQGATTAVTGDVYGTYNSSSLPSFTNPEKTGYTFQGWYTQEGGGGNFVINTSREFQASKNHWTNASCQFIRPSTSTSSLYAKWTQTVTLKANTANHGSGTDKSATATWNLGTVTISTHCTPASGYKLEGYYTDAIGGTKILNADGSFAATNITNYITDSKWTKAGATTLYAHYEPLPKVYLKNTMNWANAYVTFYKGEYWDTSNGAGSSNQSAQYVAYPAAMTYNASTGLFEYQCPDVYTYTYACFTKDKQDNYGNFWQTEAIYCNNNLQYEKVVVVASATNETKNETKYYTTKTNNNIEFLTLAAGEGTGWFFPGGWSSWETKGNEGAWNNTTVRWTKELSENTSYEFKIYNHGVYYGNAGTYTASGSKTFTNGANHCTLTTTLAGTYTFDLNTSTMSLTISYPAIYAVSGSFNDWTQESNLSFSGNDGTYSVSINGSGTNYEFKVIDDAIWYGHANKTFTATESNVQLASGSNNIKLKADIYPSGSYTFSYNKSTHKLGVTYPTSYVVTFGKRTGGNTVTAKINNTTAFNSETKIANGTSVTFAQTALDGYTFEGWYNQASGGTRVSTSSSYTTTISAATTIYSNYTANQYTVTLNKQSSAAGHGTDGTCGNQTVTYNAVPATITPSTLPTAANGYAFMGFYTAVNGGGSQIILPNGTWAANVTGYTGAGGKWTKAGGVTLYAYYKKAEITALTFDVAVVAPGATVGVTPTIDPIPNGSMVVCWTVLHSNDNPLDPQPTITSSPSAIGNKVTFPASETSGMYKVKAELRKGTTCDGDVVSTFVESFQVAGDHTVTLQCQDASGNTIQASSTLTGKPLEWTSVTAPEIFGYTFNHWQAGDGITLSEDGTNPKTGEGADQSSTNPIYIKAIYDGRLTAVYSQNAVIYFKNTLNWSSVYVNFYSNDYWGYGGDDNKGSGNNGVTNRNKAMIHIDGTDVWYYDYGAAGITPNSRYVSFTQESMDNYQYFHQTSPKVANVVYPARRSDDLADKASEIGFYTQTPMFVPLAGQTPVSQNNGRANYYNSGYWTKFVPGTGYTLEIYNDYDGSPRIKSIPFSSSDELMPMKALADLEANKTYRFQLKRDADVYYGNSGTMTYANHGQSTAWEMSSENFAMCKIKTNAAGDYTFNLSYSANSSTPPQYRLRMEVDYPIAGGDYRAVYYDAVQGKYKASGIVPKVNNGKDTVSFFIRPASSPVMNIQQAAVNASTGAITWTNYYSVPNSLFTSLSSNGVYNVCIAMDASGGISSVEKIEPYTGNYYIRVDCANSKWDNYRSDPDHLMTYSDYSIEHGGYSHYYTHWVQTDDKKNVKFCIANDYSPSISDTLARETASGDWANITYYIEANGDLKRNANVRFMWNNSNNAISRAYVDGAQEDGSRFLVISSTDGKITKADGSPLSNNEVTFTDNENWIYEANIKAKPEAAIKLISTWGTSNTIVQYFKGSATTTEQLIGGSGEDWYDIRLLYDFKTNRLVASWVPSDGTITSENSINADIMFIREHQGDIAQLTFTPDGSVTNIKTAYGVMRFNKWTLANKEKTGSHSPLSSPASIYERSLFWISFPFRVKLSEVFGFGTYMSHWAVQRYDGADRAAKGHFLENGSFWKWMNRSTEYLEPNQGYLLAIDVDLLGETSNVWGPDSRSERIELYFPSYGTMPSITDANVSQTIPSHECTINWYESGKVPGPDTKDPRTSYNRTIFDSHWNVISVPTYVNTSSVAFANTTWTTKKGPRFLYTWNADDNTITATTASGYTYHAMHAYMTQYAGGITWSAASGSPSSIIARRMYDEAPQEVEFRLELQQNEQMIDQTFVMMSADQEVSVGFNFGEDLTKEFNANKSSIYTFIPEVAIVAGNTLPISEQTTIVPVGVDVVADGDYTFSMPNGTSGVGVTLIDGVTGERTNLALTDYTVSLEKGTYDQRFVLEISPIEHTTTAIENSEKTDAPNNVCKKLIDGVLYIIKDGKVFDARGARLQ